MKNKLFLLLGVFLCLVSCQENSSITVRKEIALHNNWQSIVLDTLPKDEASFVKNSTTNSNWSTVTVPHNWDQYYGYRRTKHGNLHGTAWYKKSLSVDLSDKGKQHFLFFEGVGSYATVWVNGIQVGAHKGGRTTFTLDITEAIKFNTENSIVVKAAHPSYITDLPWVCGGCSGEWGFSEGSQPMGIFRPVTLVITDKVRIEPFGVHIYNDSTTTKEHAVLHINTELKNYGPSKSITLKNTLFDANGTEVVTTSTEVTNFTSKKTINQTFATIQNPKLWSPDTPYLYTISTKVYEGDTLLDELQTPYGIRWVSWPVNRENGDNRFFINDQPLFVNGTCEYEHLIGKSHSFSDEEIKARIGQVKAAGYNAFREGHQPHNLKYQEHLDQEGILFWSQFSAHIWYDTPAFKENFKTLLKEWVKERRNNPSVVMWGLQNESTIPKEFAAECTKIIQEMDPTAATQRNVTTCNGGEGTDWNVIQNWSGTYGGDPYNYGNELIEKYLNGEYGAWRTADVHTEGEFNQKGILSENRFAQLMEIKVREANRVKDSVAGQYHWLLYSHENPGRTQNGEGYRDIDKVGPVNYKGLFTIWGEPLDAFYMYRANYVSNKTNPMVYIVSHSWPNRWAEPGIKNGIDIYSNCDEVELFNDVNKASLGRLKKRGLGTHFQWNNVDINNNVLYAVGYVDGKPVAKDYVVLNNLSKAPNFDALLTENTNVIDPKGNYNYVYRVNAGGADFKDSFGNLWMADVHQTDNKTWGSHSWTDDFTDLPDFYASQRATNDPILGTANRQLFQSFRYGTDKLEYNFPLPDGEYEVELYFIEPWYGTGGGMDCEGWRLFDVAINEKTVLENLDVWKAVGHDYALKKSLTARSKNGQLKISFPKVAAGQAIISAIAIATKDKTVKPAQASPKNIIKVKTNISYKIGSWLGTNSKQYIDADVQFTQLPADIYGADFLKFSENEKVISGAFTSKEKATVYVIAKANTFLGYEQTIDTIINSKGKHFNVFKKEVAQGEVVVFNSMPEQGQLISTIAIVPTYDMGEKEDRPVLKLEALAAKTTGNGIEKAFFKKSDYVGFTNNTKNSISFTVSPGVANNYLLRYRYMNTSDKPISVHLKIEDANGILVHENNIDFPIKNKKWKILNTSSGGFINAGTYKISISGNQMEGLRIASFEFQ